MSRLHALVPLAALAALLSGCGSGEGRVPLPPSPLTGGSGAPPTSSGPPPTAIALSARSASVTWSPTDGKTTLVLQFSARRENGVPLQENELQATLSMGSRPLDNESLLQRDAQALAVNVRFCMVLDASYSMLEHSPQAYLPMKTAARDSIRSLNEFWESRSQQGAVSSCFLWFEEKLNWPTSSWRPDDLLALPDPPRGSSTKLLAATHAMVSRMAQDHQAGLASGERDMHVLVVFSDGADNYSWWDNAAAPVESRTVSGTGLTYQRVGYRSVNMAELEGAIAQHPRLTVHTIGFGNDQNEAELRRVAEAGRGVYVRGSSSEAISTLFARVLQEATTVQTVGATMPLPPGDYSVTLRVRAGSAESSHTVSFHAGDAQARVLP